VAAVLLGLLRHEADVGRRAHRRRVEGAVLLAVADGLVVERRVGRVGDDELGVLQLVLRVPHLARAADRRRHRGVDDDVARHVQVGDAAARVDLRQRRTALVRRGDRVRDRLPDVLGELLHVGQHAAEALVRVGADARELVAYWPKTSAK
jgi:hypothetical protein